MGKPAFVRAYGPGIFPPQAAEIGAAQLPHSAGIPLAIAKNPSQFRQGRDDRAELDKYGDMDDAKAAELIKTLVAHHVALVPTFIINYRATRRSGRSSKPKRTSGTRTRTCRSTTRARRWSCRWPRMTMWIRARCGSAD